MKPFTILRLQKDAISLQNWMKFHIGFKVRQQSKQLAVYLNFLYKKSRFKNSSKPFLMFRSLNA